MTSVVPSISIMKSLEEATAHYQSQLSGSDGEKYLESRGISKEVQVSFRLGYVGEALIGDERYRYRISIPYLTPNGPVSMRFRSMEADSGAKYLGRAGDVLRPYNVLALRSVSPRIYITEGEFDCIMAYTCSLPAIGIPGSKAWLPVYSRMLRYRRVVVLADGDEAGYEFAEQIASEVEGCKIVSMPEKMDVNSYVLEHGEQGLRDLLGE